MDTRDLAQTLKKAEAQVEQAQKAVDEARPIVEQMRSQTVLAAQEMERANSCSRTAGSTKELFDQRQQQLDAARALQLAAEHRG